MNDPVGHDRGNDSLTVTTARATPRGPVRLSPDAAAGRAGERLVHARDAGVRLGAGERSIGGAELHAERDALLLVADADGRRTVAPQRRGRAAIELRARDTERIERRLDAALRVEVVPGDHAGREQRLVGRRPLAAQVDRRDLEETDRRHAAVAIA